MPFPFITVIPDGDNQTRTSQVDGETFVLASGDATTVDGDPVVVFANDGVTFRNDGTANTTGITTTVVIEGDRGTVDNGRNAEISAEQTAIDILGEDALIDNDGLIVGGFNGVNFVNGGLSSGLLRNDGTISSDSRAVNIGGDGVRVENYGRIIGTDDQRNGTIYSDATANDYSISNRRDAVVDAGLGNDGAGIALQLGSLVDGSIDNTGTIRGRGQAEAPSGLAGDGIRLFSGVEGPSTFEGNITNDGRILSDSEVGPVAGLRVANGVNFDGTITNGRRGEISGANNGLYFGTGEHDARVENFGLISSDSRAVNIDGSGVDFNNFGRIIGTGDQRNGTVYAAATAEDYSVFNGRRGVIDAGEGNQGSGVALQTGDVPGDVVEAEVVNLGSITGRGEGEGNLTGHGVRVFAGDSDGTNTFLGDIVNEGRITSDGAGGGADGGDGILVDTLITFEGEIFNSGTIDSADDGIEVNVESVFIGDIVNTGRIISEDDAIFVDDVATFTGDIINDGTLDSEDEGIELDPSVFFTGNITNNGRINAEDDGIFLSGGVDLTGDIVNNGSIRADEVGIFITDVDAFDGSIINRGTVTGDADRDGFGASIDASIAQVDLTVLNTGRLNGDVLLGEGDDLFDGANGRVDGDIFGGGGEDQIFAGSGSDVINGGSGNDTLTGGDRTDTFVFELGTGSDTVTDFSFSRERLDVSDFFADQASALAAARQDGADTVIDLDLAGGDEVRLLGVNVADLDADNFLV